MGWDEALWSQEKMDLKQQAKMRIDYLRAQNSLKGDPSSHAM